MAHFRGVGGLATLAAGKTAQVSAAAMSAARSFDAVRFMASSSIPKNHAPDGRSPLFRFWRDFAFEPW